MVVFLIYQVTCMKMEIFIALLVVLGPIVPLSEGTDTCFVDTPKLFYITDVFYGDIFNATVVNKTEYKGFNITKNTAGLDDEKLLSYFNLTMKDNVLIMSTTDSYKNFAKLAYSDDDVAVISTTIFLTCSEESNDEFMSIVISDSFSHLPVFEQNSYEYGVAMPIMPTLDITYYGTKIQVSEDNFSNKDIKFSIDPDDFTIDSVRVSNKIFNASFSANKVLQFSDNQTYILTATNSIGNHSSVPLIIYADEDSGLDSPLFQKAHYSFEYSDGDLKPKDGVIKVNSIKLNESNYDVEGDNKENFKLTFDNSTGEFPLELLGSLPSTLKGRIVLDLKFTTDASTSTVLLINIAEVVPTFSSAYYGGVYNPDSNAIEWDVIPNVSKAVSLTIDENVKTLFTVNQTDYTITPTSKLTVEDFDGNGNIIFTLTALSSTANEAEAAVVVSLQSDAETELQFADPYYEGSYGTNSKVTLNTQFTFKDLTDFTGIEISVDAPYNDNFNIELKDDTWTVKVIKELSKDVLNDNTRLLVPITGTKSGLDVSAKAVLMLDLPEKVVIQFTELYYTGTYLQDDEKDSVRLDKAIKITGVDGENAVFSVEGYEENFAISCNFTTLECSLSLKSNLNSTSLSSEELFLTLVASTTDQFSTGRSILLLKLPLSNSTFKFDKQLYQANYNIQSSDDELATISLVDAISLKGAYVTNVSIVCDDKYSHYFKFELTTTGWKLQLQKNIEAKVLSGQSQLITSLTASNSELTSFAKATFIVNFPNETSVAFDKLQYFGDYIGGDSPSVAMEDEIVVSNPENSKIALKSFSEFFEVIQKKTDWLIKPKTKLNSTILSQYSEINTEMSITKIGVPYGKAVLTIRLPEFSFSKKRYSGNYVVDDENVPKIDVQKIQVADIDEDYVEVSLSDYSDYFKITLKSGVCTISVTKLLPSEITNKYGTLVSTLAISRKSDNRTLATSTLVITLPDAKSEEPPKFSGFSYYGDYKNSDTPTVELQQPIELAYDNEAVIESVKIDNSSGHYASNFEIKKEDYNNYIVGVVKPLAQEILDELSTVVLTLVANSTQNEQDYAALVIALPKSVRNASVQVENQEILFNGTYDDGKFSSPQISLEFANSTKDSDVRVNISNDLGIDSKHFHYSYSSSKKLLTIQIDPFSDDLVSDISVIPLKLAITDINTQDTIFAVLNVKITDTNSRDIGYVGLIVAVSILAGLLLLLVVAAFVYWFYKIRKVKYSGMINQEAETPNKTSLFTKNETKKPHGSASLRRPTGLGIGVVDPIPEDTSTDGVDETPEDSPEVERKVAFDDNVKKIEIDEEASGFKSVANRRPTEFVFGYPLESCVLDNTSYDRRESSDYNVDIPQERRISLDLPEKKSVAFDEKIERMHIDPVEADDSNHEDEEEEDQAPNQYKTEAELHTADEEQLPSQIFKEIF